MLFGSKSKTLRIAICDDQELDRTIERLSLEDYLEARDMKAKMDEFESGEVFLKSNLKKYDLAVLDIYMAGDNGIETAKNLLKKNPNIKIMFCTASPEFFEESEELDAIKYFIKPLNKDKLANAMDLFFLMKNSKKK